MLRGINNISELHSAVAMSNEILLRCAKNALVGKRNSAKDTLVGKKIMIDTRQIITMSLFDEIETKAGFTMKFGGIADIDLFTDNDSWTYSLQDYLEGEHRLFLAEVQEVSFPKRKKHSGWFKITAVINECFDQTGSDMAQKSLIN